MFGSEIEAAESWRVAVCVASGPSLTSEQTDAIEAARAAGRCRVIVVNDNWRLIPRADVLYACDGQWWKRYAVDITVGFAGELWTQDKETADTLGLCYIKARGGAGLSKRRDMVHGGGNSGYQAIGLAYLFGARRIILTGYDMQNTGGLAHWFGNHPADWGPPMDPSTWLARFRELAIDLTLDGVDVINATTSTALQCFRRASLADALDLP